MNKVSVKVYKLKEFPQNSKVTNQSDEIKRILIEDNEWKKIYQNLLKEIRLAYGYSPDSLLKLYWKDEDDELVTLSNEQELKTAHNISSGTVKVYLIEADKHQHQNASSLSVPVLLKNVDELLKTLDYQKYDNQKNQNLIYKSQKHHNVNCSECKGKIVGIRYMCKHCVGYNLCENCKKKGAHQNHSPFLPAPPMIGFDFCCECFKEMTNNRNSCKDCLIQKVPQINNNSVLKFSNWEICDECKVKHHSHHAVIVESVKESIQSNRKIINEIQLKRSKGEEIKSHFGINCYACERNGVSLRSISYKADMFFLCPDCFVEGVFINMYKFIWLSNEEAQYERSKRLEEQTQINENRRRELQMNWDLVRMQANQRLITSINTMF